MAQAQGIYGKTCIDFETSFGVAPGTKAGKIMPFITNAVQAKQNISKSNVISGTRNDSEPFYGNTDVSGTITTPVDLKAFGWWLKAAVGSPTTTGTSPNYTHTYKVGTSLPSMIIERLVGSTYFKYTGCKVNSLKMSVGGDGELTAELEYVGATSTVGATAYDSSATTILQTNKLNNFQAAVKINGTAQTGLIKTMDFTVSNNLVTDSYTIGGNGFRGDVPEGAASVSGSIKALFTDTTLINYGINQTEVSLELVWTIDANTSLSVLFPEVKFSRTDPTISGPGGVEVDLAYQGYYNNDANASIVVVTLKNQTASYA